MAKTFADSINGLVFDGQTPRIEFGVTRLDDVKANAPRTARRYPACRLVLTPATAVELIVSDKQIGGGLTQAGVVKATSGRKPDDIGWKKGAPPPYCWQLTSVRFEELRQTFKKTVELVREVRF